MSATQTFVGTLVAVECGECGVTFGMTSDFIAERQRDHRTLYCPNGHLRHYPGQSKEEAALAEAERQRALKEQYIQLADDRARQRDQARRQAAAARGQVTRIKRRVGKGVCPCCNRTFQDLARHMSGQHPDWSKDDA
jgi:hypothetical protein